MITTISSIHKQVLASHFNNEVSRKMPNNDSNLINLQLKRKENEDKISRKSLLTSQLYEALNNESLEVYYQAQVNIQTGNIIGAEALLRWNHPELGFVSPEEFIPIAEKHGLINDITEWVLRQACLQAKKWSIVAGTPLRISVNISPYQLRYPNLASRIRHVLQEVDFDPNLLTLELVETTLITNFKKAENIINELRKSGISIALDDFGTGYASLNYLQQLPFDSVKIDKSFITSVNDDERTMAIVKGMIAIAKALNLKIIAEGVETQQDLNFLLQEACDFGQGYFFSRPLMSSQFTILLSEYNYAKCA
jgi:EAL domain-containing protein (putative c-di-GMP-specific phosphodiesterase class I)